MSNNAHELSNRLLNALDSNYNVVDMQTVNEIISILEKFNITKELLETTRLGKHVNELRRKTSEPTLARRAKVLVKRWRDLVIPTTHSPAHTGSNRSSAERQVRRLGGTPLTSPALSRNLVSPAVPSPRPPSRPAWGGYESDSQDVILVDDDPPPPATPATAPAAAPHPAHKPATPPVKRALSPEPVYDEKKAKRDKKPKKRRGHGRAGSGTETTAEPQAQHNWVSRNGTGPERRRNGWRREPPDPYTALVNRLPPAGAKKVKTTKELLEQIQSRGNSRPSRPASPRSPASPSSPASPDVMLIEPDVCSIKVDSPLRNGGGDSTKAKMEPKPEEEREEPLPLEEPRTWEECTCGEEEAAADCPAAGRPALRPLHVRALHNALLPGLNGTRAPLFPHRFAVRPPSRPDDPTLFSSVVPLYNYSDYADDHCVKNMSRVPLCESLPWTDFAPSPPAISPPPSPPPLRPYPSPLRDDVFADQPEPDDDSAESSTVDITEPTPKDEPREKPKIEPAMVGVAYMEPGERLKAPLLDDDDEIQLGQPRAAVEVEKSFVSEQQEHRTVERTKAELDGRGLYSLCEAALASVPYRYSQAAAAPVLTLPQLTERDNEPPDEEAQAEAAALLEGALETAASDTPLDALGRPQRPALFAEWHECAKLGDLVALPYVVID